ARSSGVGPSSFAGSIPPPRRPWSHDDPDVRCQGGSSTMAVGELEGRNDGAAIGDRVLRWLCRRGERRARARGGPWSSQASVWARRSLVRRRLCTASQTWLYLPQVLPTHPACRLESRLVIVVREPSLRAIPQRLALVRRLLSPGQSDYRRQRDRAAIKGEAPRMLLVSHVFPRAKDDRVSAKCSARGPESGHRPGGRS